MRFANPIPIAALVCWLMSCLVQAPAARADVAELELGPASLAALGIEVASLDSQVSVVGGKASGVVVAPPGQSHAVSAPFAGVVIQVLVLPGMTVAQGQQVALLYSPEFSAAKAQLEMLRLDDRHEAHLAQQARELQALGLRSEQEAEEAEHQYRVARLALAAMEERLARVVPADQQGSFYLRTAAAGVVSHVKAEAGESVGLSAPVLSLFQGDRYWARAKLPERLSYLVEPGSRVALSATPEPGIVVAVDPEVDPTTRSTEILIELPERAGWRIGQLLDVTFETEIASGALAVPVRAVIRIGGQESVFLKTETGFRVVPVKVLLRSVDRLVVSGALATSDRIAVSGLAALKNMTEGAR